MKKNTLQPKTAEGIVAETMRSFEKELENLKNQKAIFSEKDYIGKALLLPKRSLKNTQTKKEDLEEVLKLITEEPKGLIFTLKLKKF